MVCGSFPPAKRMQGMPPLIFEAAKAQQELRNAVEHNEFTVDAMAGKTLAFFCWLPVFSTPTITMRPGYGASSA
jgi:hypothetical protein